MEELLKRIVNTAIQNFSHESKHMLPPPTRKEKT